MSANKTIKMSDNMTIKTNDKGTFMMSVINRQIESLTEDELYLYRTGEKRPTRYGRVDMDEDYDMKKVTVNMIKRLPEAKQMSILTRKEFDEHMISFTNYLHTHDDDDKYTLYSQMSESKKMYTYLFYLIHHRLVYPSEAQKQNDLARQEQKLYDKDKQTAMNYITNKIDYKVSKKSFNQLFNLVTLKKLSRLTPDDQQEIYNLYLHNWNMHNQTKSGKSDTKPTLTTYKEKIYDDLLDDIQPKSISKNQFETYLRRNIPDAMEHLDELYRHYRTQLINKQERMKKKNKHKPPTIAITDDFVLPYPFQTVRKRNDFINNNNDFKFNPNKSHLMKIPDKKIKPLKKLMRPNFAPNPYSWEIDHLQFDVHTVPYLFILNINTRFLYAIQVDGKSLDETIDAIEDFIKSEQVLGHPVHNIKGDGDKAFASLKRIRQFRRINFYFQSSPFTYHNKNIDAVMRTLRDALGPNTNQLWDGKHDDIIQQLVHYYNNTWHRAINMTPTEMHADIDKEWSYIRKMTEQLNNIKRCQIDRGYHSYEPGTRLMLHLEYGKTNKAFDKRRRRFDVTATFIEYRNGNAYVKADKPINGNIEVPLFYTALLPSVSDKEKATFGGYFKK